MPGTGLSFGINCTVNCTMAPARNRNATHTVIFGILRYIVTIFFFRKKVLHSCYLGTRNREISQKLTFFEIEQLPELRDYQEFLRSNIR